MVVQPDLAIELMEVIEEYGLESAELDKWCTTHKESAERKELIEGVGALKQAAKAAHTQARKKVRQAVCALVTVVLVVGFVSYRGINRAIALRETQLALRLARADLSGVRKELSVLTEDEHMRQRRLGEAESAARELEAKMALKDASLGRLQTQLDEVFGRIASAEATAMVLKEGLDGIKEFADDAGRPEIRARVQEAMSVHMEASQRKRELLAATLETCELSWKTAHEEVWRKVIMPVLTGQLGPGHADKIFLTSEQREFLEDVSNAAIGRACIPGAMEDCFALATAHRILGNNVDYKNALRTIAEYDDTRYSFLARIELSAHADPKKAVSELSALISELEPTQCTNGKRGPKTLALAFQVAANLVAQGMLEFRVFIAENQ